MTGLLRLYKYFFLMGGATRVLGVIGTVEIVANARDGSYPIMLEMIPTVFACSN